MTDRETEATPVEGVAIIGMAGRFPGARSVAEFWRNQLDGIESISHFRIEDLEIANATETARDPHYVRARSVLEDVDLFDAEFFGIYPREAELMDPQQRLFLECCWQTLEDAGYDPDSYTGQIGVFAGSSVWSYFLSRLCTRPGFIQDFTSGYQVSNYSEMMGNSLDFLSTKVSYKLNLRGPSFTMLSACSTSLLAVTQACQSLLTYQSDMAIAGGVSITFPQKRGYYYQPGGMVSADGHCRAFDADAQGTVFGSGVATVLLKRAEDAVRDGDQIYAIIRGYAVNNDGSEKIGYTAPSIEGQARVIAMAQEAAGVEPDTIGYIEAHGTGTPLGDPIELAGLTQAFRARTSKTQFCTIGTAKTNVGHLDVAAGITGLINATQIVRGGVFPPTLHFRRPNPNFDFASSPFRVNTKLSEWNSGELPRRAGVSSFGVGGTNAHVVIEQAPEQKPSPTNRPRHLIILSARSRAALDEATDNLTGRLKSHPSLNVADVAYTLQVGRRAFDFRRAVTACDIADAISALSQGERGRAPTRCRSKEPPALTFLFPGQGSQRLDMGREIFETEPTFRDAVRRCAEILRPHLGVDLCSLLYPPQGATEEARRRVTDTIIAQPAIFTIEYALAQLWMNWGIRPQSMVGHSVGEFVAACLAGVFSLEDALALIATRGRMMQELPAGGMLSVRLPEGELRPRLSDSLSLAAVNSPSLCVVAGPFDALERFEKDLERKGIAARRLVTSHAFHSAMMDPLIAPFTAAVAKISLNPPQIPYLSCVTGTWVEPADVTDPGYWARHARNPVRFSAAMAELLKQPNPLLLEVGPGNVLSTLARQQVGWSADKIAVASLSDGAAGKSDAVCLMDALGSLWLSGIQPNWRGLYAGEGRQRVSLPTYPFELKRYWLAEPAEEQYPQTAVPILGSQEQQVVMSGEASPNSREPEAVSVAIQPVASVASRTDRIRAALVEIFEELSGMDVATADGSTTFLEMGFDSLFLTQVTQALQSKFGLKITFRQLLGDESTLNALTQYVDNNIAPDAFAQASPAAPPVSASPIVAASPSQAIQLPLASSGEAATSGSAVERLVREQLQVMNELFARQLEALRGSGPVSTAPAAAAASRSVAAELAVPPAAPSAAGTGAAAPTAAKGEFKAHGPYRPVQKSATGELSERQRGYLAALIERHTKRTPKSKSITQDHRKVLADPRVVSGFRPQWKELVYPIVTVRSEGSRLWDVDGNEYIDLVNGFGPIMLGHRPDFVETAIEAQLREGFETGPQTPLAGEVAKIFCEMTGNERMTFCNTGSEAVIAALRVARTVTGRSKVVMFTGDYHGMFDEVLVKGFKNKAGVPQSIPVAPGIPRESVANMIVLDYGAPESLDWIRQNAHELAAVLVEPVQSRHPALQPVEFLREVRKITAASGSALIFDEIVTGFRVHPGGCQALFDIRADLATYGKVVAGGMPIGILAGKAQFMDALDGGAWQYGDESYPEVGVTFFAGTFVRHPLALAAAKAVLQHLKEQGPALQQQLTERTVGLVRRLNEFCSQHNIPTHAESFGSFFYLGFSSEEPFASLFYWYMRDKGIHIREGFPCFLTTAHTDADVDSIVEAFKESAIEMRQAGFFHAGAEQTAAVEALAPAEAPITESQLEVWLSDQLGEEASCSYNESFTLHMRGEVNEAVLRRALNQVVNRHDALRATFSEDGDRQRFAPKLDLEIPTIDLSQLTFDERDRRVREIIENDARTPFRLAQGPLARAQWIKMEARYQLLIFTSHHIVCDGWSTNVLVDELAQAYNAMLRGAAVSLPVPMSFASYANSQAEFSNSPEGDKVEQYWLEQFKQPAPLLDLPTDRPRPAVKGFAGATHRRKIGADAYGRIKKMGARQKCTLFATLLTGLQVLLNRLSGQDDIVIGIPTAGQSLVNDALLVGHCVNFIPLRASLAGNPTAAGLLAHTKQVVLAGYDHQNYTYGRLVRKLALQRDPGRLPLTEIQFNLERVGEGVSFEGFAAEIDPNPKRFVNFDIFLNIRESKDGLAIDCDYNTDLFDDATIARWLDHYELLLEGMVADVDQPISRLPMLSASDRKRLLEDWNPTRFELPAELSVHGMFETQVRKTPDSVAAVFEDKELTYRELDARANQLAHRLQKLGVRPGVLVGLFVERSLDMVIGLLGVMKSGGAYVPIDPTYPVERLRYVLDDARAAVVLTQAALTKAWSFGNAQVVQLDRDWESIAHESAAKPSETVGTEDLAYVIYTSGSTGKPKGVQIPHRAVVNLLQAMRSKPGLNDDDVLAAVTTLSFDISGLELFLPLCVGAKLVIVGRETAQYGVQLLDYLKKIKATVMQATPVTWRQLIDAGWSSDLPVKSLCGGEAFPRDLANELVRRASSVWNMYGPTETTIWSAVASVEAGEGAVRIGHPIANTQFYVLDAEHQLVPIGVPGELYIAGFGVARGYLNRPELTSERFITNPFTSEAGALMYRTGDIVRRHPDGSLEFLGRSDDQIKLRGFRIELGEIEAVLASHPEIAQAAVVMREDVPSEKRLVAYLIVDGKSKPASANLRDFVVKKLPAYMAPAAYVYLEKLPLTPNGKVDRRALPAPDWSHQTRSTEFVPPRSTEEEKMAAIWSEVLRLERVGIADNLFELGADSLHVLQIAARARKAGIAVTPRQLLEHRTIGAILHAASAGAPTKGNETSTIKPVARTKFRLTAPTAVQ